MAETQQANGTELEISFGNLKLKLPDFTSSGATEQTYDETKRVGSAVVAALKWIADKDGYIAGIDDRMKRRIMTDEMNKKQAEIEENLKKCLNHEVLYFKLAAAMAYLRYYSSLVFKNSDDASKMLADTERRGLLIKDDHGPILINYQRYRVGEFGLEPEDNQEIETSFAKFSRGLMTLIDQNRQSKTAKMKEETNIDMDGLRGNKIGRCCLLIPPESYKDNGGKTQWRRGGSLLVEATDKEIIPISASGAIEQSVKSMREMDVRLQRYTLGWDCPPGAGQKAFSRIKDEISRRRDITDSDAEKHVNLIRKLWYLIDRAFKAIDANERLEEVREEFQKRTTITQNQFFGLEEDARPKNGIACVGFEGALHTDNKSSVYSPFFLVERSAEHGTNVIKIVDMPPPVYDLLGTCVNREYVEGSDFGGLPNVFRRTLCEIRRQLDMAAEIAKA